jgi:hypothetical protein
MELRDNYERARQRFDAAAASMVKSPLAGDAGKAQQSRYAAEYKAMARYRDALIAAGEWDGHRPIRLKHKYRP